MQFQPMQVAYYHPTESFREITEHIAVRFEDMTLVAVCGASEAQEDSQIVNETRAYARLFAESPNLLEKLEDAANALSNAQVEWASVDPVYAPEWTHELKAIEQECRDAIEKVRGES